MLSEQQTIQILADLGNSMPGFIAAALVDLDSGMTIGMYSKNDNFDLSAASAFNSEMVKQKRKIMASLNLNMQLEDMLITLTDQIHLIKLVNPTSFVYLAADRSNANLAIVRASMARYTDSLAA
ncbi:roadblock/LC7 domain-containing protein [Kribbella sp. NPDC051952]|uniref:roadblock/LC7 domain-containing protein n=1 Tax=Kribbella sp. NPDC051952 TaxID=3154851 RepID=UPI00342055DA